MNMIPMFLTDTIVLDSFTDKLMYGLKTTLLGMGVVFAVLIILWAVLAVFKLVFYKGAPEEEKPQEKKPDPAAAPTAVEAPAPVAAETDDAELVAVITAAVAAMMDKPQTSFRVVSFRRTASK